MFSRLSVVLFLATGFVLAPRADAVLIAQYLFNNNDGSDTSGSANNYDLTQFGAAPAFQSGIGGNSTPAYVSDGNSANYFDIAGPGGNPQWSVSVWAYTTNPTQTANKAFLSNNNSHTEDFSWQIALTNGNVDLNTRVNSTASTYTTTYGASQSGVWENFVLHKTGGSTGEVWRNGSKVDDLTFNPGGLHRFRVGINRGSNSSFDGLIDDVQVWWNENPSAAAIYAAGVGIPEPSSTGLLLALASGLLIGRRRRTS